MNFCEARWRLAEPAAPYMGFVERRYRAVEEGLATLEDSLPWIRVANQKIEALLGDSLPYIKLDGVEGEDRYRLKYFVPLG